MIPHMEREEPKERVTISISKKILDALDKYRTKKFAVPRSQVIEKAISDFLEKEVEQK